MAVELANSTAFGAADNALQTGMFTASLYYLNPIIEKYGKEHFPAPPKEKDEETGLMKQPPNIPLEMFEVAAMTFLYSGLMYVMKFEGQMLKYIFEFFAIVLTILWSIAKGIGDLAKNLFSKLKRGGVVAMKRVGWMKDDGNKVDNWFDRAIAWLKCWIDARVAQYNSLGMADAATDVLAQQQDKAHLNLEMASIQFEQLKEVINLKIRSGSFEEKDYAFLKEFLMKTGQAKELVGLTLDDLNNLHKSEWTLIGEKKFYNTELTLALINSLGFTANKQII